MPHTAAHVVVSAVVGVSLAAAGVPDSDGHLSPNAQGHYVVVVSRATWDQPAWRPVIAALRQKHDAAVQT